MIALTCTIDFDDTFENVFINCTATNTSNGTMKKYTRKNMEAREAMKSIVKYLEDQGETIESISFPEINIG